MGRSRAGYGTNGRFRTAHLGLCLSRRCGLVASIYFHLELRHDVHLHMAADIVGFGELLPDQEAISRLVRILRRCRDTGVVGMDLMVLA